MPQFDFSTALPQILWLVLTFVLLYLSVSVMLPKLARVVADRQERIASDLRAAEAARRAATEASSGGTGALEEARAEAMRVTGAARSHAADETAHRLAALDSQLAASEEEALKALDARRAEALSGLDAAAAELTVELVQRVAGVDVSPADAEAAIQRVAA
jgi:F-type H+-transporting ATPase subunit b